MIVADCPWCPARLDMLPVAHPGVVVLEFTEDAWQHLAGHTFGAVGSA